MAVESEPTATEFTPEGEASKATSSGGSNSSSTSSDGSSRSSSRVLQLKSMGYEAGANALSPFGGSAQQVAEQGLKGASSPVDQGLAGKIASTTGVDVSHGRKHTGPEAQEACNALGAEGFTLGNDTAFASANPSTHTELHEYAHLAQQTGVSKPSAQAKGAPEMAPSSNLEVQADQVADAAMAGKTASVSVGETPSIKYKKPEGGKHKPDWVDDFAKAHNAEIRSIIKHLRGHTSDNDCMKVLHVLRHWDMNSIRACWFAIEREEKGWLDDFVKNVGSGHFKAYPREVYATYKSLDPKYAWNLVNKLTSTGVFDWNVSEEEAHNAFLLLRAMPSGWADQYREKNPKAWKAISRNLPSGAAADLDKSIDPAKEKKLRDQEKKRQTDAKAEADAMEKVGGSLKEIIKKLETGFTDWAVTDSEAISVHREFIQLMGNADSPNLGAVGAVVRKLEEKGFIDKWLKNLPDSEKYAKGDKVAALITVMRVRPPEASLNFINSLLSMGLFDWAVTDSEAKLAYYLIRQQPPSVQSMFRQQDNGFWLKRMESNLNQDVVDGKQPSTVNASGETIEDAGYGTFSSDAELEQAQAAEKAFKGRHDSYKDIRGLLQKGDKKSLISAFDKLVAESDDARRAMVRRLDATGLIEGMFKTLGLDFLWDSRRRHITLKILVARDPQRSAFHVEELTKGGWFDAVTATEAYLAFQLIKSMPQDYRDRLSEAYPEAWSKIMAEVNTSMKKSDDLNLYTGGKDGSDRQSILAQVNDKKLWEVAAAGDLSQLENVLRMAIAAGHRIEANKTAIKMGAFKSRTAKEPNALMGKLGFFAKEEHVKGDGLKGNQWWDEGILQSIKEGGTAFIEGLDLLFKTDKIGLSISAVHVRGIKEWSADVHLKLKGLPLDEVQDVMGGDVSGIKFAASKDGDKDGKGAVNKIDAEIDYVNGIAYIKVDAPEIQIESINTFRGENKVQTGPVSIKGIKLRVAFDVEKRSKIDPSGLKLGGKDANANHRDHALLEIQSAEASDVLFITAGSMVAAKKFSMNAVKAEMHEIPVPPEVAAQKAKGKDAALKQLEFVPETMARSAGGLEKGKAQKPEPGQGMVSLSVGNLGVEGLTTSSGYKADKAELKDFELKVSNLPSQHAKNKMELLTGDIDRWKGRIDELGKQQTKSEVDTAELARLKEQIKAAEAKKTELAASLPELQKSEARYLELYQKQRSAAELNEQELAEFTKISKTMQIGATVSVGEVSVSGIGTKPGERMGNASVKGVSGAMELSDSTAGQSNNLPGLTSLSHSVGMAGMVNAPKKEDKDPDKVADVQGKSGLELNVDQIKATNIKVPGSIPDYKDMCAKRTALMEASDNGKLLSDEDKAKLTKLDGWWEGKAKNGDTVGTVVTKLLALEKKGDTTSSEYLQLREALRGPETTVGEIDLRGAKVTANNDLTLKNGELNGSSSVGLSVGEASVKDIKYGDHSVDSVTATNLSMGGAADLVNVTKDGLGKTDMTGELKAGSLSVKGVKTADGTTIKEASIKGFHASASPKKDGSVSVGFDEFSVKGVYKPSDLKQLDDKIAALEANEKRTEAEDKELASLKEKRRVYDADRARLEALEGEIKALEKKLKRAKGNDKHALQGELDAKKGTFKALKSRLDAMTTEIKVGDVTLKDMRVEASGLGNPLVDGHQWTDRDIALKVSLGELGISGVDYVSGDMVVRAPRADMKGFLVDVNVKVTKNAETGKHELAMGSKLNQFKIDHLGCQKLHLEMPMSGEKLVVDVPYADLFGLEAKNIPLEDFSPKTLSGELKVDKVRAEAKAELGKKLTASGRLAVDDLRVRGYKNGKTEFNLGDLTLDKLKAKGSMLPAGFKTAALTNLSANATLDRHTGDVGFTVGLGSFTVDGINYSGKQGIVTAKQAAIKGVHLTGSAKINPALISGEETKGKALQGLKIDLFKIDTIEGTELGYDDGAGINVKLKRGYFEDIQLKDFDLNKETFDFNLGKAGITGLEADVQKTLKKHGKLVVKANATASVSGISVKKGSDGKVNFGMVKAELEKLGLSGSFKGHELKKASIDGSLGGITGSVDEDGTVQANLAKSGLTTKGLLTGPDGTTIDLAASLQGLNGSFKVNPDGSFSTTVGLDSVGLDSLDAKHNQGHIKTGQAGIKGMSVTLKGGVGPDPKDPSKKKLSTITVESFRMDEAAVNSLDLDYKPLNLKVKAPKAGIYGIWAKGLAVDLNTKQILAGGSAGVNKLDSGKISTEVGAAVKASGQLTATDFQIDFLKGGKHSWTLKQLSMQAGVVSTDGYSGGVNNFQLDTVTGTNDTKDGSYQVGVKGGSGNLTGEAKAGSLTIPGSDGKGPTKEQQDAARKKGKLMWKLPFLDALSGIMAVQLPVHVSDARLALGIRKGELLWSVPAASLKLPFEEMWGFMVPKWASIRLLTMLMTAIRDFYVQVFGNPPSWLRKFVEGKLNKDPEPPTKSSDTVIDLNALSSQLLDKVGKAGFLVDILAPSGHGVSGTLKEGVKDAAEGTMGGLLKGADWVGKKTGIGRVGVVADGSIDRYHKQKDQMKEERRRKLILDWIRKIKLGLTSTANGGASAMRHPEGKQPYQFLDSTINANINAPMSNLEEKLSLSIGATATGVKITDPNYSAALKKFEIKDTKVSAGVDQNGTMGGKAGVGFSFDGLTVNIPQKKKGSG